MEAEGKIKHPQTFVHISKLVIASVCKRWERHLRSWWAQVAPSIIQYVWVIFSIYPRSLTVVRKSSLINWFQYWSIAEFLIFKEGGTYSSRRGPQRRPLTEWKFASEKRKWWPRKTGHNVKCWLHTSFRVKRLCIYLHEAGIVKRVDWRDHQNMIV